MLTFGARSYRLVTPQSGFHVTLGEPSDLVVGHQWWTFDAQYVPEDGDAGPPPGEVGEHWQLTLAPMNFETQDWQRLIDYVIDDDQPLHPFPQFATNLLDSRGSSRQMYPGDFKIVRREGYFFHCEFEGEIVRPAAESGAPEHVDEFTLRDAFPFRRVTVHLPVNSPDPVKAARAIAARDLALLETTERTTVSPYDPARGRIPRVLGPGRHSVTLEPPWHRNAGD